jgi:hypothetical protein
VEWLAARLVPPDLKTGFHHGKPIRCADQEAFIAAMCNVASAPCIQYHNPHTPTVFTLQSGELHSRVVFGGKR